MHDHVAQIGAVADTIDHTAPRDRLAGKAVDLNAAPVFDADLFCQRTAGDKRVVSRQVV